MHDCASFRLHYIVLCCGVLCVLFCTVLCLAHAYAYSPQDFEEPEEVQRITLMRDHFNNTFRTLHRIRR